MDVSYQLRDGDFFDYDFWAISDKIDLYSRGPRIKQEDLDRGNYFCVLGAAETVGVHAPKPYGFLLKEKLGLPCLNLGRGGASIAFFNQPENRILIEYMNKGKFIIITLMSARHIGNSLFSSKKGTLMCYYDHKNMKADQIWTQIVENHWGDHAFFVQLVTQIRAAYVNAYIEFLKNITVPAILFYFSQRGTSHTFNWDWKHTNAIWDKYPHLVDEMDIRAILTKSGALYAKCVSKRGIPYILKDRSGKETPLWIPAKKEFRLHHWYYPSQEMHEDAAHILEPICKQIITV